ncbi:DNA primase DnaG [Halobacterium yunchengense]|uniref:DNA primase DnaG n=1 Tax=Halobacterium yunchengense TaxID=3108497 RepID=UPI003009EB5F
MEDTAKYLIHADFVADGVVERTDVVGAAFGQTEGLLGDDLDIRDLQDSAKLGRIDVSVDSEGGQSFGTITIASSLDRVETATLAAALEAVERIGPCRAQVEVQRIEDVRAAKRRDIVDRAKELLATAFDEGAIDSEDILREVRESVRVEDITEYEGLPAGPNVASSDAVLVVEGRADVSNLLQYGIKNAVAVEGTDVPDAVADLTADRTATAFLDGDRGGDMIRRELDQVGDLDYVARAPRGESVEDLSRQAVDAALRDKTPADAATPVGVDAADADGDAPADSAEDAKVDEATAATDGSTAPAPETAAAERPATTQRSTDAPAAGDATEPETGDATDRATDAATDPGTAATTDPERGDADDRTDDPGAALSLSDHVDAVAGSGTARFLDGDLAVVAAPDAADAFAELDAADDAPRVVVLDDAVTQRLLDVAAQRDVATLVGASTGEFVKQPAGVRVHTFEDY